jgi:hypothetical protein
MTSTELPKEYVTELPCQSTKQGASIFLNLHQEGTWGDVSPEEDAANLLALVTGRHLFSRYRTAKGIGLWVITEADRSATTILLPGEQ